MEQSSKQLPENKTKSREYYKKIWLSLFEWKTLSSCHDEDADLFSVCALLKSAFNQFTKLKKRLNDSQNLVDTITLELKKTKYENEKFTQKLKDLKTTHCTHCQCLSGIQSFSEGHAWDSTSLASSSKVSKVGFDSFAVPLPVFLSKRSSECNIQNPVITSLETRGVRKCSVADNCEIPGILALDGIGNVGHHVINETGSVPNLSSFAREPRSDILMPENVVSLEKINCRTPEKKMFVDQHFEKSSPVLNSQKRSKKFTFSPIVVECNSNPNTKHSKSPSFLISELDSTEKVIMCSQTALEHSPEGKGPCITLNPRKKLKISALSLKQRQPKGSGSSSQPKGPLPQVKLPLAESGVDKVPGHRNADGMSKGQRRTCMEARAPLAAKDIDCSTRSRAGRIAAQDEVSPVLLFMPKMSRTGVRAEGEDDDDEIVMPSPNSTLRPDALMNAGIPGDAVNVSREIVRGKEGAEGDHPLEGSTKGRRHNWTRPIETDTEATYFVPLEEEEEESGEDDWNHISSREDDGDAPCTAGDSPGLHPPCRFITSFDRVPPKSTSPKFKYQRAAVRKKSERMQLEGWECKACQKYYDAAGVEGTSRERKLHVNRCSRHRDRFSPRKCTPKGYWDLLFPETPEG